MSISRPAEALNRNRPAWKMIRHRCRPLRKMQSRRSRKSWILPLQRMKKYRSTRRIFLIRNFRHPTFRNRSANRRHSFPICRQKQQRKKLQENRPKQQRRQRQPWQNRKQLKKLQQRRLQQRLKLRLRKTPYQTQQPLPRHHRRILHQVLHRQQRRCQTLLRHHRRPQQIQKQPAVLISALLC